MNTHDVTANDGASRTVRAVVFDRDQTLVHFDRAALAVLEVEIRDLVPALTPRTTTEHWMSWPGPWPRTAADEPVFWTAFWGDLAQRYDIDAARTAHLITVGSRYHTCYRAYDDAPTCLDTLRRAGLRLAVLTNFELPSIDRTLAHAGIEPGLFAALSSSATSGAPKPHAGAYRAILAALDLPAADCMFVDDLPENVAGAAAIGMHAVLLDRDNHHPTWPGIRVTTLTDLPALLGIREQS